MCLPEATALLGSNPTPAPSTTMKHTPNQDTQTTQSSPTSPKTPTEVKPLPPPPDASKLLSKKKELDPLRPQKPRRPVSQMVLTTGASQIKLANFTTQQEGWEPGRQTRAEIDTQTLKLFHMSLSGWESVFNHLPNAISLYSLSCVSKLFNDIVWTTLVRFRFSNPPARKMVTYLRRCQKKIIKSIDFSHCSSLTTPILNLQGFIGITALNFTHCPALKDQDLARAFSLPNLRYLVLSNCVGITDEGMKDISPSIVHLDLSCCFQLKSLAQLTKATGTAKAKALAYPLGLTHLNLANCYGFSSEALCRLESFQNLKYLNLRHIPDVTVDVLNALKKLKLQYLNLAWCRIASMVLEVLGSYDSSESLEYLNLAGNDLTDKSATILSNFKNLIYLNCAHCSQLTDTGTACIMVLLNLEKINLFGCNQLTDLTVTQLSVISGLQHIILSQTAVTDRAFVLLEVNFPSLLYLSVCGCSVSATEAKGLEHSRIKFLNLQNTLPTEHSPLRYLTQHHLEYLNIYGTQTSRDIINDDIAKLQPKYKIEFSRPIWDGKEPHGDPNSEKFLAISYYYSEFNSKWVNASSFRTVQDL